jgi:hypothetical protein
MSFMCVLFKGISSFECADAFVRSELIVLRLDLRHYNGIDDHRLTRLLIDMP